MDVYVKSPNPALAKAAANALTESFSAEQERLMHVKYIQAITPASIPDLPSWPKKNLLILIGVLFPLNSFPAFMSHSLLFLSFLFATFLPILTWKLK